METIEIHPKGWGHENGSLMKKSIVVRFYSLKQGRDVLGTTIR